MNALKHLNKMCMCSLTLLFLDSCGSSTGANDEEARKATPPPLANDKSVLLDLWATGASLQGVAIQSDNKIVAVGHLNRSSSFSECSSVFTVCPAIVRYNADGTRDTAYGTHSNGIFAPSYGSQGSIESAYAVAIDAQNRAVFCGYGSASSFQRSLCGRLSSTGRLDTTFTALNASITGNQESILTNRIQKVAPNAEKILIAGRATVGAATQAMIARLGVNGAIDTTFGTAGYLLVDAEPGASSAIYALHELADGKIMAAGFAKDPVTALNRLLLVRFSADGVLDTTFNSVGYIIHNLSLTNVWAQRMFVQADGKIVIAGRSTQGAISQGVLARFLADGSLDTAGFNAPSGYYMTANADTTFFSGLALEAASTIMVSGSKGAAAIAMRFNADGTVATSFGTNGEKAVSSASCSLNQVFPMALLSNGYVIQGGNCVPTTGAQQPALIKYFN